MHKKYGYLSRYIILVLICLIMFSSLIFVFSNYLFTQAHYQAEQKKLENTLETGIDLLDTYAYGWISSKKLWEEVNPVIDSGDTFLMLLDPFNNILAYTDHAVPYFVNIDLEKIIAQIKSSDSSLVYTVSAGKGTSALLTGKSTATGTVIAGRTRIGFASTIASFRSRLLIFIILIFLLLLPFVIFGKHHAEKPTKILTEASTRLLDGETIEINENLPGEMREIASAFNHVSRTISKAFAELKYEKETMQLILESLNEGVLALDAGGKLLHENNAAVQLLGGADSDASNVVLNKLSEFISQKSEANHYNGKLNVNGRDLLFLISSILYSPGQPEGAVALIRDITEQERLEKTRHDYVANISHELRTPLASIRGIAEGLRDGMATTENDRQRCLNIIVDESTRLSRLVNDLLELSGLQSNPGAFETEKVDPVELILELHDRNLSLFQEAGLSFNYDLKKEDDGSICELPFIISNEDRLTEVLTIFVDNARKYTPKGGSVTIGAEQKTDGIRFFVADTGIGMDEESQRLAFDRFHQAEKSHSDKGSGLGLAIAKEIMQKMDVHIDLVSAPGKGSTFSFVIPLPGLIKKV